MNTELNHNPASPDDLPVWDSIQTYETILEVFPEDIEALDSLVTCYERIGDKEKFLERARKLLNLVSQEKSWPRVLDLAGRILKIHPGEPEIIALREAAESQHGGRTVSAEQSAGSRSAGSQSVSLTFELRGELDLAWFLLKHEIITQDQYEVAIDRLSESSMNPQGDSSLALLQELREMDRVDMDKIINFLTAETGIPFIELSRCECDEETTGFLPLAQSKRLGILPFDHLGRDLMVCILNPVDPELRQRLTAHFKTKLHFFFTSPDEFHGAITKLAERMKKNLGKAATPS